MRWPTKGQEKIVVDTRKIDWVRIVPFPFGLFLLLLLLLLLLVTPCSCCYFTNYNLAGPNFELTCELFFLCLFLHFHLCNDLSVNNNFVDSNFLFTNEYLALNIKLIIESETRGERMGYIWQRRKSG